MNSKKTINQQKQQRKDKNIKTKLTSVAVTAYFGTKEQCGDVPNRLDTPEGCD